MFNPSREQVRQFFCSSWKKHLQRLPLVGAEVAAVDIALLHPEYHALLAQEEMALAQEWTPERGETNPFLHLSLHLAVHEQVSINQPYGVRDAYQKLLQRLEPHAAQHVLLECLGEVIWQAQRQGRPLDAVAYVESIQKKAGLDMPAPSQLGV